MSSLIYKITEAAAGVLGHKRVFRLSAPELKAYLQRIRGRQSCAPPAFIRRRHLVREEIIGGRPCYLIMPKESAGPGNGSSGAVLFLHGGGYIFEAHWVHWLAVSKLVRRLGVPFWLPSYPLLSFAPDAAAPDCDIHALTGAALDVYREMLAAYPGGNIAFLGDSAGAALSLTLCHHIKALSLPLPMPDKLVLLSPAMLTEQDPAILGAMRRIEPRDVLLSMQFMDSMISLLDLDLSRDNYFNAPLYGDFQGFPRMYVFSGAAEIFYPQVEPFVERARAAGVPVEFHSGRDMMHVWPYMPYPRECRAALDHITRILSL